MDDGSTATEPHPLGTIRPAMRAISLKSHDFDEIGEALSGWDHRLEQLDRGRFTGRISFAAFEGVQLFDVEFDRRIYARGSLPPNCYVISPVHEANLGAVWRGRLLRPGSLNITRPGDLMEHRTSPTYRNTSLVVEAALLHRIASDLGYEAVIPLFSERQGLEIDPSSCLALSRQIGEELASLSPAGPGLSPTPDGKAVIHRLLRRLFASASSGRSLEPPERGWHRRAHLVRSVEEYLRAHTDRAITIQALCSRFDISERTLHYAFREVTGLSPKAYLKARRLNQLRRDLKEADPRCDTIGAIAARWGFTHPGELAADYNRMFGELPSRTLSRA
jgi:AraC family ethanolamine operon transcriptional activator